MKKEKRYVTNLECLHAARQLKAQIFEKVGGRHNSRNTIRVYGVPRGGIPVAYLLAFCDGIGIVDDPNSADVFVDDVIDSGRTADHFVHLYKVPFLALGEWLTPPKSPEQWLVFPWEIGYTREDRSADDIVIRLLQFVGEDPSRGGLIETPKRVLRAWQHWCGGYGEDPKDHLKTFDDGGENYDQMVTVKDIPFYSTCEHHLAPFFGTATISYIPNQRVVGLSKLSRVLGGYARRLQVQERLTVLVADCLQENLSPKGVGVLIKARHLCMESRGISQQGHFTITTALRGEFMEDHKVRDEFLAIAK